MKKVLLFICFLFIGVTFVKADYNALLVDPEYTTLYPKDEMTIKIGYDDGWMEALIEDTFVDNDDQYIPVLGSVGKYKMKPIRLVFDNDVFDLDISNMKIENEIYVYEKYDKRTKDGKIIYTFYFDTETNEDIGGELYDGKIDNYILSNLKLSVKDGVKPGTYYIETLYYDNYGEDSITDKLPITIIENKNTKKTINDIKIWSDESYGIFDSKEPQIIKVEDKKYKYGEYLYLVNNEIEYLETSCNIKCKMTNIGSSGYLPGNIKVSYLGGGTNKYEINNLTESAKIKYNWLLSSGSYIIIVSNDKKNDKTEEIKKQLEDKNLLQYFDKVALFYNYNDLNIADKKILSNLGDDFTKYDKTHLYIIDDKKIVYKSTGDINDKTLYEITTILKNNLDKKGIEPNTPEKATPDDEINFNDFIIKYFPFIAGILIVIIGVLIASLIKLSKKDD